MIFIFCFCLRRMQVIALGIAVWSLVHTVVHLACNFPRLILCDVSVFNRTLGSVFDYKQPSYASLLASPPGVTGIIIIIIMSYSFILATHWFRRNVIKFPSPFHRLAGFNAFWYAHHLLAFVYILLIIHGSFIFLAKEWFKKSVSHGLHYHHHISIISSFWVHLKEFYFIRCILVENYDILYSNYKKEGIKLLRNSLFVCACACPKNVMSCISHIQISNRSVSSIVVIWTNLPTNLQTWIYIVVPVSLYTSERIVRAFRSTYYTVSIVKVCDYKMVCGKLVVECGFWLYVAFGLLFFWEPMIFITRFYQY